MIQAIASGIGFVVRSPRMVLGLWLVLLLVALPGAIAVGVSVGASAGSGLTAERLIAGFDMSWFGEYEDVARGLERTFRPQLIGIGAFLQNLEDWLDGDLFTSFPPVVAIGVLFGLLWALLMGGVVERAVHGRGGRGFAQAVGYYGFRFVRLTVLAALCYAVVYGLHGRVFEGLKEHVDEMTSERSVLAWSLAGYGFTALLLVAVHLSFAYARIATVLDDRASALLAAARGMGFVVRNPLRTFGLFLVFAALGGVALLLYAAIAPGATTSSWVTVLLAFLLGQAMLIVRLSLKLALVGAEASLYASSTSDMRGK